MTTWAPVVLTLMMILLINRSKCVVLHPHSALLPRHPLFRIRSVIHITIFTLLFSCQPIFSWGITNQPNSSSGMANLVFWILTCFQCPFPCPTYSGAISLVCLFQCVSVFSFQMNCIHLHVFVTSTVWQVVLSFPFPLPPIQVRISNNHHWLVWCPDSRPDQTRPGINNWQGQYFA